MNQSICQGCGRTIVWGVTPKGTKIPLDPKPPIYWFYQMGEDGACCRIEPHPLPRLPGMPEGVQVFATPMVSHFATCPKAEQFSASSKRKE